MLPARPRSQSPSRTHRNSLFLREYRLLVGGLLPDNIHGGFTMISARFSPFQLEQLKKQAKRIVRQEGLKHTQALDQIARGHGFGNWSQLAKGVPDLPPTKRAMRKWFEANHTAAVNVSPYDSAEGGYLYPLVEIEDALSSQFPDADSSEIEELAIELDAEGPFVEPKFLTALDEDRAFESTVIQESRWSPPLKKGRYQAAEVIEVDLGNKCLKVACVRYSHYWPSRQRPGQLIFRCPVCNKVHYHGGVTPYFGGGNGERVPHCITPVRDFSFDLVEVSDPSRAGHIPKNLLRHIVVPSVGQ